MKYTTTDGKEYIQPDMCGCGQMNTAGYCPKCMGPNIIRIPPIFQVVDLGGHWEFNRKEIYEEDC